MDIEYVCVCFSDIKGKLHDITNTTHGINANTSY